MICVLRAGPSRCTANFYGAVGSFVCLACTPGSFCPAGMSPSHWLCVYPSFFSFVLTFSRPRDMSLSPSSFFTFFVLFFFFLPLSSHGWCLPLFRFMAQVLLRLRRVPLVFSARPRQAPWMPCLEYVPKEPSVRRSVSAAA